MGIGGSSGVSWSSLPKGKERIGDPTMPAKKTAMPMATNLRRDDDRKRMVMPPSDMRTHLCS
ncbi:protein of unknown function [Nitrospira japonica]|uniref:Uncharacterized protein n=1 Tax=Nitrospira japonica TaxID=1325564 RepID=A0A1W1I875_9BACT|nr:protein of unknown function [Nitrospira japonica]